MKASAVKLAGFFFLIVLSAFVVPLHAEENELTVKVSGADAALKENIELTVGVVYDDDVDSYFFQGRLEKAVRQSTRALGYYDATFSWQIMEDKLLIKVEPGPVVRWAASSIKVVGEASELAPVQALVAAAPFKVGKALNHGDYEDFKQELLDTCLRLGYQSARFTVSELRINKRDNLATAVLQIDTGIRYKVTAIEYFGSSLKPEVLSSLAVMAPGDWYSRALLSRQYKYLLDTGYFSSVEVDPVVDHANGQVTIDIKLQDRTGNRYLVGVGYGTDTGARVSLRWSRPLVNKSGHSFYSDLTLSEPIQEITTRYTIPLGHPLDRSLVWGSGLRKKNLEDTKSRLITTGLNLHTSKDQWQRVVGANIENEKYRQGDQSERHTRYIVPVASWSYTFIEGLPARGYRFWFNTQASSEDLGSDTNFFRVQTGIKYMLPITQKQALLSRLELGILVNDDFDKIPSSKRFFTGGDQTVRGYSYESISSRDSNNELTGGDYLNVASLEYRYRIKPQWTVATFVDTGRAYLNNDEPFNTGVGVGARWQSPIGQVSFDVAFPVDAKYTDGFQIHIYMGPSI